MNAFMKALFRLLFVRQYMADTFREATRYHGSGHTARNWDALMDMGYWRIDTHWEKIILNPLRSMVGGFEDWYWDYDNRLTARISCVPKAARRLKLVRGVGYGGSQLTKPVSNAIETLKRMRQEAFDMRLLLLADMTPFGEYDGSWCFDPWEDEYEWIESDTQMNGYNKPHYQRPLVLTLEDMERVGQDTYWG